MKKYNEGDKVVIRGDSSGHEIPIGSLCVIKEVNSASCYLEFDDGYCPVYKSDFQPAHTDRIPASDGHEGETAYQFISTDQQSI